MLSDLGLDAEGIRATCARHGVERLRVFGSAVTDRFDRERSDLDFLVDFIPGNDDLFSAYFGLQADLERIAGRAVDLVDAGAVQNPYFRATAFGQAQELYAA